MSLDCASFDLKRDLRVSPARLWEILTDPRHREHWGAPEEGMVLQMENEDLRVGGHERHRCGPAEAPDFVVETRWYRLDAPERAAFTETLVIGDETLATSLVTYALSATDQGTKLEINVAVSSFSGPEAAGEFRGGWEGGLANLETYLTRLEALSDA